MININCEKYNPCLDGILKYVNANDIPSQISEYIVKLELLNNFNEKINDFNYLAELEVLYKNLGNITSEDKRILFFKNLFMSVSSYFLYPYIAEYKSFCLGHLKYSIPMTKIIFNHNKISESILSLLFSMKYKIERLDKIILLVDEMYTRDASFRSIESVYQSKVSIQIINKFDIIEFDKYLTSKSQMFIFGHGNKTASRLGGFQITPDWLIDKLNIRNCNVKVLGLFSCQENLSSSKVKENVDYFITDKAISVPIFSEIFMYSYLMNYLDSGRIKDSFEIGILAPIYRTSGVIQMELYEAGKLVACG